jgi:D-alanyl-D-alanine carboxypeptidase
MVVAGAGRRRGILQVALTSDTVARLSAPIGKWLALVALSAFLVSLPGIARAKYADIVIDADTGEVLHATNVDGRNYPASLTKMMTLYLLFDDLDSGKVHLSDRMMVSRHAASQAPTKLGLAPGKTLSVEHAMLGIITKSANDASVTLAEYLGGSEPAFAQRMTQKAHELGMSRTVFKNANGLPNPEQKSTARDMATLARALIHNHAKYYHYFSTREFAFNNAVIRGHNHLLDWYDGADGIKTGYIDASGFNLVTSAKRDGRRLVGVVFGGQTAAARDRQMARLLDAGFSRTPGSAGIEMAELPEQEDADEPPAKTNAVLKAMAKSKGSVQVARHASSRQEQAAGDADDEEWGIQVGSFAQPAKALQVAQAAVGTLGKLGKDATPQASAQKKGRTTSYRARITGFSKDEAQQACRTLAKHHRACRAVNLG